MTRANCPTGKISLSRNKKAHPLHTPTAPPTRRSKAPLCTCKKPPLCKGGWHFQRKWRGDCCFEIRLCEVILCNNPSVSSAASSLYTKEPFESKNQHVLASKQLSTSPHFVLSTQIASPNKAYSEGGDGIWRKIFRSFVRSCIYIQREAKNGKRKQKNKIEENRRFSSLVSCLRNTQGAKLKRTKF